ncbi:FAD-dependent oxidoreductase [Psychromarinibacter sp. S121]|uniref:FAD-dependent oxidoreductase n=1 Tax=Psychromarinibacter sp. S121 TaxID=3415127 RepID=UPI003C7EA84B
MQSYDLAITGAGIAGLNALFVAAQYLPKGAKVALIDRRDRPGGMWTEAYDYVRLHQPHAIFTAGDLKWQPPHPPSYLARGDEVQGHLASCLARLRGHFELTEYFGRTVTACEEAGDGARLVLDGGEVIGAARAIHASGFDVHPVAPLSLSSGAVVSTTPERLSAEDDPARPVYVVGGGKTGMDTIQRLAGQGREIRLINGKGTLFLNRTMLFPEGPARWLKAPLQMTAIRDCAIRYDGTNEDEAFDYFRRTYTISATGGGEQFLLGILSEDECAAIRDAMTEVLPGYLDDVIDGPDGPVMRMRDGTEHPVASGSVFVNCTGHLLKTPGEARPLLSGNGAVLSITPRASVHFLSSLSSYFASHLFFLGTLAETPLWVFDAPAMMAKGRKAFYLALLNHGFLNTMILADALPLKALNQCGLDPDRWFPLPRRLAAVAHVTWHKKRYKARCARTLTTVRDRFGIACAPHRG